MGGGRRRVREVLWPPLARCSSRKYAAAFARDDAPDEVVLDWYSEREDRLPLTARLQRAAFRIARWAAMSRSATPLGCVTRTSVTLPSARIVKVTPMGRLKPDLVCWCHSP